MQSFFRLLPFYLFALGWCWAVKDDPFFWDTVQLASKHAHFFYGRHLKWALLPPEIDSGHPPVFGYLLAIVWRFWGYSLPTAHFMMFPFLCLNIWGIYRLASRVTHADWGFWLIPVVFLDPVFAGQSVLVSPDIVLLGFFMLSVEGLLGWKRRQLAIGLLGLVLTSMRGMMCVAGLGIFMAIWFWIERRKWQFWAQGALCFLPAFIFGISFLAWHYHTAGWIGYHTGSTWAPAFKTVGLAGIGRNFLILIWRWLDFGRVGEWMLLGLLWKYSPLKPPKPLIVLWACMVVLLSFSALKYQNLSAHRYFLPAFFLLHLLTFQWIYATFTSPRFKRLIYTVLTILLASGNLWIYPLGVSMDWDSTLAHLPFHPLRARACRFLDAHRIDYKTVGTAFPNINTGVFLQLNEDTRQMSNIQFDYNAYIFVSNVMNEVERLDYRRLEGSWNCIWQEKAGGVFVQIWESPKREEQAR